MAKIQTGEVLKVKPSNLISSALEVTHSPKLKNKSAWNMIAVKTNSKKQELVQLRPAGGEGGAWKGKVIQFGRVLYEVWN